MGNNKRYGLKLKRIWLTENQEKGLDTLLKSKGLCLTEIGEIIQKVYDDGNYE